jgi:hypothetical protein
MDPYNKHWKKNLFMFKKCELEFYKHWEAKLIYITRNKK